MTPYEQPYLRAISLLREQVPGFDRYPFSIPAVAALEELEFHPKVTFLVGENGSGKSTLLEAIAIVAGFNAEGGSRNFHFATRPSESELHRYLRPVRGVRRPKDGFFLRAESFFNVGTEIERLGVSGAYGGSVHEQSHGESFLALATERFGGHGLYILDEPEAALSPSRQLSFLVVLDDLAQRRASQFIIATHSPIILAYPHAKILQLGPDGLREIAYEQTEHFRVTKDFLNARHLFLKRLLGGTEE
jgi:predicted ATPase